MRSSRRLSGLGGGPGSAANAAFIAGNTGPDTTTARARLSNSMNANSSAASWVLTATGTTPALMEPRKAVGKSIVSWRHKRTRCSGWMPSRRTRLANRLTRSASSA